MGPVHVFSASSGVTELPSAVVLNAKPYRRTGYQENRRGGQERRTGEQDRTGRDRRTGQESGAGQERGRRTGQEGECIMRGRRRKGEEEVGRLREGSGQRKGRGMKV